MQTRDAGSRFDTSAPVAPPVWVSGVRPALWPQPSRIPAHTRISFHMAGILGSRFAVTVAAPAWFVYLYRGRSLPQAPSRRSRGLFASLGSSRVTSAGHPGIRYRHDECGRAVEVQVGDMGRFDGTGWRRPARFSRQQPRSRPGTAALCGRLRPTNPGRSGVRTFGWSDDAYVVAHSVGGRSADADGESGDLGARSGSCGPRGSTGQATESSESPAV